MPARSQHRFSAASSRRNAMDVFVAGASCAIGRLVLDMFAENQRLRFFWRTLEAIETMNIIRMSFFAIA
jgi:hypothetical protein